ncbi:MAG: sugar phosphate isomerase/epimerase [Anaerolineae bacterium]|nr:sugar phosphate isomerase/epimerase [Anaerolineae bacterium]
MPVHVAVRAAYPEQGHYDWAQSLAVFQPVGFVEVAFYRPELFLDQVQLEDVAAPFSSLDVTATSIHMAQARVGDIRTFAAVLRKTITLAQRLACPLIVVHPTKGRLTEVGPQVEAYIQPLLADSGVVLCWETFEGKHRFLAGIEGIAAFCAGRLHHAACYDTSHLHKPQDELLVDIARYGRPIRVYHLSNRGPGPMQQHLPLRDPAGVLDFRQVLEAIARSDFSGPLVLEYLHPYHDQLVPDALWARQLIAG